MKLKGFKILERNYRLGRLEIDIIARDGKELVFVEVKVRRSNHLGGPLGAVDWKKQREITRVAAGYLLKSMRPDQACRFDVVGVVVDANAKGMKLMHVSKAFEASGHLGFCL